jgi:predicted AAA+ superfamily ATPase
MKPQNSIPDPKNQEAFDIVRMVVELHKTNRPFIIGITGAGGAGKTTFGVNIEKYFGSDNCVSIDLDDYLIDRETNPSIYLLNCVTSSLSYWIVLKKYRSQFRLTQ